ncbi:unnamed protein product [Symbiodinium sp. CCMP2592]|nr:unnamed protein product [Symbiodinium sp. CCMP2592]
MTQSFFACVLLFVGGMANTMPACDTITSEEMCNTTCGVGGGVYINVTASGVTRIFCHSWATDDSCCDMSAYTTTTQPRVPCSTILSSQDCADACPSTSTATGASSNSQYSTATNNGVTTMTCMQDGNSCCEDDSTTTRQGASDLSASAVPAACVTTLALAMLKALSA